MFFCYNEKYQRVGHLFQDRYRSKSVEYDRYFLSTLRYIHWNPIKIGASSDLVNYKEYLGEVKIADTYFALVRFNSNIKAARDSFQEFHKITEENFNFKIKKKNLKELVIMRK